MLSRLKRLFNRSQKDPNLDAILENDSDLDWLNPPADRLDVGAWDRYWIEHIRHGIGPQLIDMDCDDRELVRVMSEERMKTVLCAGNGISQEPRALAEAGFEVVVLDISPQAIEIAQAVEFSREAFEFFCEPEMRRAGGCVEYVVGNIFDTAVCAGPFDVIIERSTAQNYLNHDLPTLMEALTQRLSQEAIFFSHCHDNAWRPPAAPRHFTKPWFQENGWTIWSGSGHKGRKPPGRVAWLSTSTG